MPNVKSVTFKINVEKSHYIRLQDLANRLELEVEDFAERAIIGAVQALENEEHIYWPIYLVQAGTVALDV